MWLLVRRRCKCSPRILTLRSRRHCCESNNSQAYHQCDDRHNGQYDDYLGPGYRCLARGSARLTVEQKAKDAIVVFVRHYPNGQQHRFARQAPYADVHLHIAAASGHILLACLPLEILQPLTSQRTGILPLNAELFHDHVLGVHALRRSGFGQFERADTRRLGGCEDSAGADQQPGVAAVVVAGHGIPVATSTGRRAVGVRRPVCECAGLEHPIRYVDGRDLR